jgi:hypothetical protein
MKLMARALSLRQNVLKIARDYCSKRQKYLLSVTVSNSSELGRCRVTSNWALSLKYFEGRFFFQEKVYHVPTTNICRPILLPGTSLVF